LDPKPYELLGLQTLRTAVIPYFAPLQVHRAVMTIEGVRRVVAVKVRHPGVADIIRRDFQVFTRDLI